MASAAKGLPADLDKAKALWELSLGTHQYSIPTIDRGRIYLGINDARVERPGLKPTGGGVLQCVEQETGRLIWQFISPRNFDGVKRPYHYNQWKCGFCSGPVVEGDWVYAISSRGEVLCLDRNGQADGNDGAFVDELQYMGATNGKLQPTDGDLLWRFDLLSEAGVIPHDVCGSTLLLHGDLLYACTSNGLDDKHRDIPAPDAPALIVLDKRTGKLAARESEGISSRLLHGHWSSPSLGQVNGQTLIFFGGGDGFLYAFEPPSATASGVQSLKKIWSYDCNPPGYRVRDGNPVPYSRWNKKSPEGPSEIIGTPVCHNARVYVAIGQSPIHGEGQGALSCVDAATGKLVWRSELVKRTLSTVAVADGLLYIADYSGNLHCFDADTGERHWVHDLGANIWGASPFVADGKVYFSAEDRKFWVLRAGTKKEVLSQTRFGSVPITPVAVDGALYVPTQKRLVAYPGR